jgi:predicted small lipoprotein YifL
MKKTKFILLIVILFIFPFLFSACGKKGSPKIPQEYNAPINYDLSEDFCE